MPRVSVSGRTQYTQDKEPTDWQLPRFLAVWRGKYVCKDIQDEELARRGRSVPREETNTQRGSGVEERGDTEALRYWKTQELTRSEEALKMPTPE